MQDVLELTYFGNTVFNYLVFAFVAAASMVAVTAVKRFLLKFMKRWAERTGTRLDDQLLRAFRRYLMPVVYYGVLLLDLQALTLSNDLATATNVVGMVLAAVLGPMFATVLILFFLNRYWEKQDKNISPFALKWIGNVIRAVIWIIAVLLLLDNLGVHVTALITGLGIGGIAVAFAAQAVLEDVFSCFTILFDKPFEVGDFIIVGDLMGTVEDTGMKTTRVRSIGGEQLIFSNKDLTSSRVKNYKRMEIRRIVFTLGVTYDTTLEKLKEIPVFIRDIITGTPDTTFDRSHFATYADCSLNFETVYYVNSSDYNTYMDVQQEINLKIKEEFDKRAIEFAFPTRTLYSKSGAKASSADKIS